MKKVIDFLRTNFLDICVIFWIGIFAQAIPTGFGGMHHSINCGYGWPFPIFYEGFQSDWRELVGEGDTVYGNIVWIRSIFFNLLIVILFSIVYVYIAKKLFMLFNFKRERVTNSTAALIYVVFSIFLIMRSWAIPVDMGVDEVPMSNFHYGFPFPSGPWPGSRIFQNVLCVAFFSSFVALLRCMYIEHRAKRL